ncbi:putative short chain dehydrogenase/reductase [Xylaria flabelliformis]|nr:putative short chain dehydrogenase/reductase [Xylaria flabelliformis]
MTSNKTTVLITGASSGIGLETVGLLAQTRPELHILLGTRSVEKGTKSLESLRATHGESLKSDISLLEIDVTKIDTITAAKAHVESTFGKLDVLINNAGIIVTKPCDTLTNLRETFETNAFGPAVVTETFEPLLKKSASPRLIYVSSDQGSIGNRLDPDYKWYSLRGDYYRMSKAAVNMLSACHRVNYAEWGCKVCAFNPDFCLTNLTGERGYEMRKKWGARDPKDPATALVDLALGKRDEDFTKMGIIDIDGSVRPW